MVCTHPLETQLTMAKRTNAGGRQKGANERSIVYVHQHGGDDVTCKPPIKTKASTVKTMISAKRTAFITLQVILQ